MPPKRAKTKAKTEDSKDGIRTIPVKYFGIPYFAHQQLDPAVFPLVLSYPVAAPRRPDEVAYSGTTEQFTQTWDESEDEGMDDFAAFVDSDDDATKDTKPKNTKKRTASSSKNTKNASKRTKIAGGRPAVAKKVTANLDSDDEIIVRMKNAKYLEKDIAKYLIDQGRTKYNPKTIGTRWTRLKKVLAERQDELLDADLTDWHDGDDDALQQAIVKADKDVQTAMAKIQAKKWRMVADTLKTIKPATNFSQNACRKRSEDLINGAAKPTPESSTNPDAATLARIESRRAREAMILADQNGSIGVHGEAAVAKMQAENIEGNAWTSRAVKYY